MTECPTEEQMFGYLEHQLDPQLRERVEEHINTCQICRMMVVSLAQSATDSAALSSAASDSLAAPYSDDRTVEAAAARLSDFRPPLALSQDKTIATMPGPFGVGGIMGGETWDEARLPSAEPASHDPSDPWLGQTIGRLRLVDKIGEGGFGTVYKAWEPQLDAYFAVKLLHVRSHDQREALKRFQREARLLARLQHPNIVEVQDYGVLTTAHSYYLVMELLQGQSLQDAIDAAEFFPIERVYAMTEQICAGLAHLHTAGMVHRDLKPANLFLSPSGVKLLDLGLATMFEEQDLTMTGVCLGSPVYISPEQAAGMARHATASSDLYSLAIILFELLTGVRPFQARSRHALMEQHIRSQPPALRDACAALAWAPDLEAFFHKALAKQPTARFASAPAFWQACRAALQAQAALD